MVLITVIVFSLCCKYGSFFLVSSCCWLNAYTHTHLWDVVAKIIISALKYTFCLLLVVMLDKLLHQLKTRFPELGGRVRNSPQLIRLLLGLQR